MQESGNGKNQANMASTESIPPLMNAMVLSQQSSQDKLTDGPVAGFLMHSSSEAPLTSSQLESSLPSHPLFLDTALQQQAVSLQQFPCSLQQSPAKPSLRGSQQSPASLQQWQISAQQSPVRSWKSVKPESRAALDGSSESPTGLQKKPGISIAPPAGNKLLQALAPAAIDGAGRKAAADAHQGRAGSLECPLHMAVAVSQLPVNGMQSRPHQKCCLDNTQTEPSHTASVFGGSSQPTSKQETAVTGCAPQHNQHSSSNGSMLPDAAFSTVTGSSCSFGRCSLGHASHTHGFVVETGLEVERGIPGSSTLVPNVATGAQSSKARLASSATDSFADCSSNLGRMSFPFMVGYQHPGTSAAAMCCSSSLNELGLLSALNGADLAYLNGEPCRAKSAEVDVKALCSSSTSSKLGGTKESSNSKQAANEHTGPCAVAESSAALFCCSSGQRLARIESVLASSPHATHEHGGPRMPAELFQVLENDDGVLTGNDSEVLLLREHSKGSVVTTETSAHAPYGCSAAAAKADEKNNTERLHSLESGLDCGPKSVLSAMYASCDILYDDDDDWEA